MKKAKGLAAVFLDRDGTINEEVGHMDRMEKFRLIPGAAAAIRLINASGMKAVVVTNQSGIARGLFDEALVHQVHCRLREMLRAEDAFLDGIYYCPHHPTEGREHYRISCGCRKPAPGMLLQAAADLGLDLARCYLVGDTLKDMEAAARAGVRGVLVRTGHGSQSAALREEQEEAANPSAEPGREREAILFQPLPIAADVLEAVQWIVRNQRP